MLIARKQFHIHRDTALMSVGNKLAQSKQQRIKKKALSSDSHCFFNILTCGELLSTVEDLMLEHRERRYPSTDTLSIFLAQALSEDNSCQKAVNDASLKRMGLGLSEGSVSTGGFCRARKRLPLEMVSISVQEKL